MGSPGGSMWSVRMTSWWMAVLAVAFAVIGAGLAVTNLFIAVVLLVVAVALALFATVLVEVDQDGLRVRYGPGWPRSQIDADQISQATVVDVRPLRHGGWGYRGSLRVFKVAAVVIRAGEGIQLDLVDGKRFVVTVDDAATGAALLNQVVTR